METKKKNNVVLIVLLIIVVGFALCFGYMWYKSKNVTCPKCEEANVSNENTNENSSNEDVNKNVSVIDAVNVVPEWFKESTSNKIKIVIPKIVGTLNNSETFNKKILTDIISKVIIPIDDNCDLEENSKGCESGNVVNINVSYKYLIKNDVVGILITVVFEPWNASGTGEFYYNYFYDIKNDKELNIVDALKKNGYDDKRFMNEVTKCYDDNYEDIKCTIEYIKKELNENNLYYVGINNNNYKIILNN